MRCKRHRKLLRNSRLDWTPRARLKDASSAAQERFQQNQAVIAELQDRLEATTRSAREAAATNVARVAQLEQSNRELKAHLLVAEGAEARVTELNGLLQKAQEELKHRREASTGSAEASSAESNDAISAETTGEGSRQKLSVELLEKGSPEPVLSVGEDLSAKVMEDRPDAIPSEPGSTKLSVLESAPSPSSNDANSLPSPPDVEVPAAVASATEPAVIHKAVKATKRKKARTDDQLHLFGNDVCGTATANQPIVEPKSTVLEAKETKIPAIEIPTPSETLSWKQLKPALAQGGTQAPLQQSSKKPSPKPQPTPKPESAEVEVQRTSSSTPREPSHRLPHAPRVDPDQLRKAVNQIFPLLAERDPGAKDCVRDNRKTFRSAFSPEAYVEFDQLIKKGDFDAALEQLRKAARKHGISA